MRMIELHNFIPFPGNYFSYVFNISQKIECNETVLLKFPGDQNLAIEAKVMQQVHLDDDLKIQFHAIRVFNIKSDGKAVPVNVTCGTPSVSPAEVNDFKDLLKRWDPQEYSTSPNHYFELIEQAKDKMRLLELVGGAICRPNKFPFSSKETLQNALDSRAKILALDTCEGQLAGIRDLIASETIN